MKKRIISLVLASLMIAAALCACGSQSDQTENDTQTPSVNSKPVNGASSLEELVGICNDYIESKGDRSLIDGVLDKQMCIAMNLEDDLYRDDMETAKEKADLILKGADALQNEDPELAGYIINGYRELNRTNSSDLDKALDWAFEMWFYRYDDSWKYYVPDEYDFSDEHVLDCAFGLKEFTLGTIEKPDDDDEYGTLRLEINFEIKDGKYYLVSFDYTLA